MDQTANMKVYVCGLKGGAASWTKGQDEDERLKERRKVLENRRNGGFCVEEKVTVDDLMMKVIVWSCMAVTLCVMVVVVHLFVPSAVHCCHCM